MELLVGWQVDDPVENEEDGRESKCLHWISYFLIIYIALVS